MTLLTVREVAQILKVSEDTVREHIRSGDLRAVNVATGKKRPRWRIPEGTLRAFISERLNLVPSLRTPPPKPKRGRKVKEEDVDAFIARWRKRLKKAGAPEGAPRRSK